MKSLELPEVIFGSVSTLNPTSETFTLYRECLPAIYGRDSQSTDAGEIKKSRKIWIFYLKTHKTTMFYGKK